MDALTARPQLMKQANLSLLRSALRAAGTATRAELSERTGISSTTVRALLTELMECGEAEGAGWEESSGGRRAERYRLCPGRYCCAAFCITGRQVRALVIDARGEIESQTGLDAPDDDFLGAILPFLDELTAKREVRSIGLGVPGIVEGGGFWRQDPESGELVRYGLGDALEGRYRVPVVLENDLNAITLGFGRCYEREFPGERHEDTNMALLFFEKGCVSAGFLSGGRLVRGSRNYAGELGLLPMEDGRTVDDWMGEPVDEKTYTRRVIHVIGWLCGVLNPQYVALGGPDFRKDCLGPIGDGLSALLPGPMCPELLYAGDVWHDYCDGMADLTARRMFDEVQFVRG